ncbi:MAG: hypothetical protein B7X32_10235 [Microbacterium sp. 13-71-7]|nr:MAG: hypothetical protein B7X32_10235 [Microbacterium sp. 13-71-7]
MAAGEERPRIFLIRGLFRAEGSTSGEVTISTSWKEHSEIRKKFLTLDLPVVSLRGSPELETHQD